MDAASKPSPLSGVEITPTAKPGSTETVAVVSCPTAVTTVLTGRDLPIHQAEEADDPKSIRLRSLVHRATSTDLVPYVDISLFKLINYYFSTRVKEAIGFKKAGQTISNSQISIDYKIRKIIDRVIDLCDVDTPIASHTINMPGLLFTVTTLSELTIESKDSHNLIHLFTKLQEDTSNLRKSIGRGAQAKLPSLSHWENLLRDINHIGEALRQNDQIIKCDQVEDFRGVLKLVTQLAEEKLDAVREIYRLLPAESLCYPTEAISDLEEIFKKVFDLRSSLAKLSVNPSIHLKLNLDPSIIANTTINTNRWSLIETIKILIDNAYKHGDYAGVLKELEINAKIKDANTLVIETKNPGTIPDNIITKLGIEPITSATEPIETATQHQHGEGIFGIAGFIRHVKGSLKYTNHNIAGQDFVLARAEIPVTLVA